MLITRMQFEDIYRRLNARQLKTNDIYRAVASEALGIEPDAVTDDQRRQAKAACYVWMYSNTGPTSCSKS